MQKILIIILQLFLSLNIFCLDISYIGKDKTNIHDHEIFKVIYDFDTKNPAAVWWTSTNDQIIESEAINNRTNDFRACSLGSSKPKDYSKTGFDKGHQCYNNAFDYSKESASLTFLMCNMCPQTPALNRGIWKKYETYGNNLAKKYGEVTTICGPIYNETESPIYIGDKVRVPDSFFKIFIFEDQIKYYIFSQENEPPQTSSLEEIEKLTNLKIVLENNLERH